MHSSAADAVSRADLLVLRSLGGALLPHVGERASTHRRDDGEANHRQQQRPEAAIAHLSDRGQCFGDQLTLRLQQSNGLQIGRDRSHRGRCDDHWQHATAWVAPALLREIQLGECIAAGRDRLRRDEKDEHVAVGNRLAQLGVERLARFEFTAVDEAVMAFGVQRKSQPLAQVSVLRRI